MGKNKSGSKLNNYSLAILKGLGYEVVPGNGDEVVKLKDLKTGEYISGESATITDLSNYEWSLTCGRDEIAADLFRGRDGEKIYIDECGVTTICINNQLKIMIKKYRDMEEIDILYDRGRKLSFQYEYNGNCYEECPSRTIYDNTLEKCIEINQEIDPNEENKIIATFKVSIENGTLSPLIENFVQKGVDYIEPYDQITYHLSSTKNQKLSKKENISLIDLGNCEDILKIRYDID